MMYVILSAQIVCYGRTTDNDGATVPGSLENMALAHLAGLPDPIKMQHLPPGYITGFGPARQSVLKLVCNVLKYARITLRNTVLKNVETNSLFKVTGNAPSLQLLYSLFILTPTPGHGKQWTKIDNQLLLISQQSGDYIIEWAKLIMERDEAIFGQNTRYTTVKHLSHLPTHEEVLEAVANRRRPAIVNNGNAPAENSGEMEV
ncbi:hypothetical protein PtB15_9B632 [Puccinia triticina]|nr:hypothetical protein PtB15_9B632 [Puccinia triticina]